MTFQSIYSGFCDILGLSEWSYPALYEVKYREMVTAIGNPSLSKAKLKDSVIQVIVRKLDMYHHKFQEFIDACATEAVFFNYPEKVAIKDAFESGSTSLVEDTIDAIASKMGKDIKHMYIPIPKKEILLGLAKELEESNEEQKESMLASIFSGVLYSVFDEEKIHLYNSHQNHYQESYYDFLKTSFPEKYERNHSLSLLCVDQNLLSSFKSSDESTSAILRFIKDEYEQLNNYSYFAVYFHRVSQEQLWPLYAKIVLFAEKFIEEKLTIGYFHPEIIEEKTKEYISGLDSEQAAFAIANAGFFYRDCFILMPNSVDTLPPESNDPYDILVLFQKNHRDEDIIPCPACRSFDTRGNSYPVLGVKSWECHNPICCDKSKYNRGKRYSFSSILKQEAIEDVNSLIDKDSVREWSLDVVGGKGYKDVVAYLVKQYSFYGDTVYIHNPLSPDEASYGRTLKKVPFKTSPCVAILDFFSSAYFHRYLVDKTEKAESADDISEDDRLEVYNASCFDVLNSRKPCSIDGAVTSPPYYNAREYSQWSNIYCYLYDIYNQTKALYNALKPGAYYLFNIFDYFDNEKNIVFSAMGKKRMILGAYIIDMFTRIGFDFIQNTIWYKGQIQGHRNTNQGNYSPYYQAPLNCYEHIFVFQKPGNSQLSFPTLLKLMPVIKMVKGKNVLGHTAPYPLGIPDLLSRQMKDCLIVDPYSGSFTSARSAIQYANKAIAIELSPDYCKLGIKLTKDFLDGIKFR